jgi:hypothetical protein
MVTRQQFADLALALPETTARPHFAQPDFRVCGKIFCGLDRAGDRGYAKLPKDVQELLLESRPDTFVAATGGWGVAGWTHVELPRVALDELRELLTEAWRQLAPKRLVASRAAELPAEVEVSARAVMPRAAKPVRRTPSKNATPSAKPAVPAKRAKRLGRRQPKQP